MCFSYKVFRGAVVAGLVLGAMGMAPAFGWTVQHGTLPSMPVGLGDPAVVADDGQIVVGGGFGVFCAGADGGRDTGGPYGCADVFVWVGAGAGEFGVGGVGWGGVVGSAAENGLRKPTGSKAGVGYEAFFGVGLGGIEDFDAGGGRVSVVGSAA